MKLTKTLRARASLEPMADADREERQVALEYVAGAWNDAEDDGIATLALAPASLFAASTSLVDHQGAVAVAELIASLPERIQSGDYTLGRSLQ